MGLITGDDGDDDLLGTPEADRVEGRGGDDDIEGRGGADTLLGGAGSDWVAGGRGADLIDLRGGGEDYVVCDRDEVTRGVSVDLADPDPGHTRGVHADLALQSATDGWGFKDTFVNVRSVRGGDRDDTLLGNRHSNELQGELGDDVIDGRGGWDYSWFGHSQGGITVDLAAQTTSGAAGNDVIRSIEGIGGSYFADTIRGTNRTDVEEWFALDQTGDGTTSSTAGAGRTACTTTFWSGPDRCGSSSMTGASRTAPTAT